MLKRKLYMLLTVSWLLTPPIFSSTFVGNGGSSSDLDMQVTRAQIEGALRGVGKRQGALCTCPEKWSSHGACQILNKLTVEQRTLCQRTLKSFGEKIASHASLTSDVKFEWVDDELKAVDSQGKRTVDAVAQINQRRVIVGRDNFLSLGRSFRIVLVTHELFHLEKLDMGFVRDQLPYGPFQNGKTFLDTLGAATAVEAHNQGIDGELLSLEDVSKADKSIFLRLDAAKVIGRSAKVKNTLLIQGVSVAGGVSAIYKVPVEGFGLGLKIGSEWQSSSGGIRKFWVSEKMWMLTGGAQVFVKPFKLELSRWNEFMIGLSIEGVSGRSEYEISDQELNISDTGLVRGLQGSFDLYIPLNNGFWFNAGLQYRELRYDYRDLGISLRDQQTITTLGASYGF